MSETDDRLAGDLVWELFAVPASGAAIDASRTLRLAGWLAVILVIGVCFFFIPTLAVVLACLAVAVPDFRKARQLVRTIPDKSGGTICARFTRAWGAWKFGAAAMGMIFVIIITMFPRDGQPTGQPPPAFVVASLLFASGYLLSAILTAMGLVAAYRSGMRVWIGEGINRARTLLLGMLLVGFTFGVLIPITLWMIVSMPTKMDAGPESARFWLVFVAIVTAYLGVQIGCPVAILIALDRVSRRVVADRPGKFGPKVSTVGKWDA